MFAMWRQSCYFAGLPVYIELCEQYQCQAVYLSYLRLLSFDCRVGRMSMRYAILGMIACLAFPASLFAASLDWNLVERLLDKQLAATAKRIEVVSIQGKPSYLEYSRQLQQHEAPASPLPELRLPNVTLRPFGAAAIARPGSIQKNTAGTAGFLLNLRTSSSPLNILPYQTLVIDAAVRGQWRVALADERLVQLEDNTALGSLRSAQGRQIFQLSQLPASFDRAKAALLAFVLESDTGVLDVDDVRFVRTNMPQGDASKSRAAWLWNSRQLPGNEAKLLRFLKEKRIDRLYLQVFDQLLLLQPFLSLAKRQGVEVYALDGASNAHLHAEPLLQRIQAVSRYNQDHPDAPFYGFQLDVEPYTLKDFGIAQEQHIAAYLRLLDRAKDAAGQLKLSVVIPFWFAQLATPGRDLAQEVLQRADDVVVMAYRRDYNQALNLSLPILAAGEWLGKSVRLGVELTPLADEEHLVLIPAEQKLSNSVVLGGRHWRVAGHYTVKGSMLSWAGGLDHVEEFLAHHPPFRSFKGWVLHSLDVMDWKR